MPENNLNKEEMKAALKEALKEWLNDKLADFGWASLKWFGTLVIAGFVYAWIKTQGWKP